MHCDALWCFVYVSEHVFLRPASSLHRRRKVVLSQLIRHCVCNGQLTTLQEVPPPQHCIAIGHHHTAMGTSALAPPPVKMPLPPLCCIEQNVSSRCHVLRQRCCILAIHDPAFSEAWRLWSNFVFRSDMWHCHRAICLTVCHTLLQSIHGRVYHTLQFTVSIFFFRFFRLAWMCWLLKSNNNKMIVSVRRGSREIFQLADNSQVLVEYYAQWHWHCTFYSLSILSL